MMELLDILRLDYPHVTEETAQALSAVATTVAVKKKEYLVEQGKKTNSMFFLTSGLYRGVHIFDGQEDTLFFGLAGDPFTAVHSLAHDEPAKISLQALEDSTALSVLFSDFRRILAEHVDLLQWWSAVLLEQVYALERRYVWLGTCDATARYETLQKLRPASFINKIPLKYIAQYLNVTPETLSRIRAKIAKK